MSEAHFIRTFRSVFGETPHRYLQRRRVERAMFLLRTTERPVTDICFETGFGSLGTFSRTFSAIVGESPSELPTARRRAPGAVVLRHGLDPAEHAHPSRSEQFRRSARPAPFPTVDTMITSLAISQIFVLDQDEALDFYVGKLGLEVATDVDLGFMRWLTVRVPGDPAREILLEAPKPPVYDPDTTNAVREMVTKGASGGTLFFNTDDAFRAHAELKGKGVELAEEPTSRATGSTSASVIRSATTSASPSGRPRRPDREDPAAPVRHAVPGGARTGSRRPPTTTESPSAISAPSGPIEHATPNRALPSRTGCHAAGTSGADVHHRSARSTRAGSRCRSPVRWSTWGSRAGPRRHDAQRAPRRHRHRSRCPRPTARCPSARGWAGSGPCRTARTRAPAGARATRWWSRGSVPRR